MKIEKMIEEVEKHGYRVVREGYYRKLEEDSIFANSVISAANTLNTVQKSFQELIDRIEKEGRLKI